MTADPLADVLEQLWSACHDGTAPASFTASDHTHRATYLDALEARTGETFYTPALYDARGPAAFAFYLRAHYPAAAALLSGVDDPGRQAVSPPRQRGFDETELALWQFRTCMSGSLAGSRTSPQTSTKAESRSSDPGMNFVLSAPRSGTTLLRVLLAGHPGLFAPPELNLLDSTHLDTWIAATEGRFAYARDGMLTALDALMPGEKRDPLAWLVDQVGDSAPMHEVYSVLKSAAAPRVLVDKSTRYAWSIQTLERAESIGTDSRYLHLVRDPRDAIASFERVRLDRLVAAGEHGLSARDCAQASWTVAQENIQCFLDHIPASRQMQIRFEDLVAAPFEQMVRICEFLGMDAAKGNWDPYDGNSCRMVDTNQGTLRGGGDPGFTRHRRIDREAAFRWRRRRGSSVLWPSTVAMARVLGYAGREQPGHDPYDGNQRNRAGQRSSDCGSAQSEGTSRLPQPPSKLPPDEWPGWCLHELFESAARAFPDAVAVRAAGHEVTYGELNVLADRCARQLSREGIGPEAVVALLMQPGPEAITLLLAILKAGGCYMPLDPEHPTARLLEQVKHCVPEMIITDKVLTGRIPELLNDSRVRDGSTLIGSASSNEPIDAAVTPGNAAYIMFTSGTTGRSKAVVVLHRGVVNAVIAEIQIFELDQRCRVLQHASPSFDTSIIQIFMALGSGATLVLVDEQSRRSAECLYRLIAGAEVTHADLPPAVLQALTASELHKLTTVSTGGEQCSQGLVARWAPGRRFFNCYGTTEGSIATTLMRCDPVGERCPPIGSAIANTKALVLDADRRDLEGGLVGEIALAGVAVARGYHRDPVETARRFKLRSGPDGSLYRMYLTGDLGRKLPDGNLEYVGRSDRQVQINGVRVEPGEVEALLEEIPGISESAVFGYDAGPTRMLAAFVAGQGPADELVARARRFLVERLPAAKLPAGLWALPSIPRTTGHKVDYNALRRLGECSSALSHTEWETVATAARTLNPDRLASLTREMRELWCSLLGLTGIEGDPSFFEVGGTSLQIAALVEEVAARFGVQLSRLDVLLHPTLCGFSERVSTACDWGEAAAPIGPLQPPRHGVASHDDLLRARTALRNRIRRARTGGRAGKDEI